MVGLHLKPICLHGKALKAGYRQRQSCKKRGIHISNILCPGCGYEQDTVEHILIPCLMSKTLWWMVGAWLGVKDLHSYSTMADILYFSWKLDISKKKKKAVNCIVIVTLWIIWSRRNEKVFKVVQCSNAIRLEQVSEYTLLWMKVIANMENLVIEKWYTSGANVIEK
ncbi:uncharacterized protein LOC110892716 [Helianthus annuus]|uniref:uncharacterized protein LOC110892716 n=1 Tax=Helianthus annuus TaxID=4232 RepID=UPI000B8EF04D|nr:uncharacterized protein LOC110892716 [Helianthus annuus]